MGAGDYMNAYNAAKQVPKAALTCLYGFHSYWYLRMNKKDIKTPAAGFEDDRGLIC